MRRLGERTRNLWRAISRVLGISGEGAGTMDHRWRILVIDDDPDVLDLINMKLTDEYDVLCIDDANTVGHVVGLFEPDLIILDIMLPKTSGYQIIEFLKRHPATVNTPVCFLSAKATARDQKYGYRLGASLYLTKPFQPERLMKNVKLFFERTPPPAKGKRYTIDQINEKLKLDGAYEIATGEAESLAREASKREKVREPAPPPASSRGERNDDYESPEGEVRQRRWEG